MCESHFWYFLGKKEGDQYKNTFEQHKQAIQAFCDIFKRDVLTVPIVQNQIPVVR